MFTSRCLRLVLGAGAGTSFLLAGGWTLLSGTKIGAPLSCEEQPKAEAVPVACDACQEKKEKPNGSAVGTCLALCGALAAWSLLVSIWFAAITTPFFLIAALATARWRLAGGLGALFAFPHIVYVPVVPLLRESVLSGLKRWLGPAPMCRVKDYSATQASEPEAEPPPAGERRRKQLLCYHPHGIYSLGLMTVFEHKPEVRTLSSPFLYHFAPIFRLGANLLLGIKMGSVAPGDLKKVMGKGESPLMLVPGGFHEATITCPGHERVFLKRRAGFVKYALRHGYDLVPVYCIGEADLMANPQGGWRFRFFLNSLSLPAVVPWGFPILPLLPRRGVELVTAIGAPVEMPCIPNPTKDDVKMHHERYMLGLKEVYDRAKIGTASQNRPLEIW